MHKLSRLALSFDLLALGLLLLLWAFFFWRVWTPLRADQVSFTEGDFSEQFVAWTHYAAERLAEGQWPQWNPYMYGGAPFQASSQTALFYPPRWLSLAALVAQQERAAWEVYAVLQMEAMLHVLLASVLLYAFVRQLIAEAGPSGHFSRPHTPYQASSQEKDFSCPPAVLGGLVAAITYAYGGYLGAYPILQSPLLMAGVWLPLILLAMLEASRAETLRLHSGWMALAGLALGLSLLAGHPQTSLFTAYMAAAWLAYRVWQRGWSWRAWLKGMVIFILLGAGLAAAQLLPTAEFTAYTYRTDLSFAAKGTGYSWEEAVNLLFPQRGQIWNSNYLGILPLLLMGVAVWRGVVHGRFWAGLLLLGALLSLGAQTPLYSLFYALAPGWSLFRGQERAMFIIAYSGAVLAGLGAAHLMAWSGWRERADRQLLYRVLLALLAFSFLYSLVLYFLAQTDYRNTTIEARLNGGVFSFMMLLGVLWGLNWFLEHPAQSGRQALLIACIVFDLFSNSLHLAQNYEALPVSERLPRPSYLTSLQDNTGGLGRADSTGVLAGGYNLPDGPPDLLGSDPLQLSSSQFLLEQIPPPLRWELWAVRLVVVAGEAPPPGVAAEAIGQDSFRGQAFTLWRLSNPRPLALVHYEVQGVGDEAAAQARLLAGGEDWRRVLLVEASPDTPPPPPAEIPAAATNLWEPERMLITGELAQGGAWLSLAWPYFPGWEARLNGKPAELYRAYGGLMALPLPQAGPYQVELRYRSAWGRIGLEVSGLALALLLLIWGRGWWSGRASLNLLRASDKN